MTGPALTLGTAGHIDHGKTALVRALTGVDTDRLPQERERGISIELGFARLGLPSGRSLSVVDVPGHERFVRTMVAGATGIDLFLLVVATDDGVMPQTREHVAVMELLEVPGGVIALTKADLVDDAQAAAANREVAELLAGGAYAHAPVVQVSAIRATGLDDLRGYLDAAAAAAPGRRAASGPARLHVDRSFTLQGAGTVVTGTLWSGEVARGDTVRIEPGGRRARVRGVEVHSERREHAAAGQRVALNLAGVDRAEVARGDVVVAEDAVAAAGHLLDVEVRLMPGARPLKPGARVHVHHGTRETPARVALLEDESLSPAGSGLAQLRLERPLLAMSGDRFVLRSIAPADTIGGGRVLDPSPRRHGRGDAHSRRLRAMGSGDPLELLRFEIDSARSGLGGAEGAQGLRLLEAAGDAVAVGERHRRWFAPRLLQRARADLLAAAHSVDDSRPRSAAALGHAAGLDADAATAVLDSLCTEGALTRHAGGYVSAREAPGPPDPVAASLVALLPADGLEPRGVDALASGAGIAREDAARRLERLVPSGVVTRVKPGLYYHPAALERARAEVEALCARDGSVTIASLRDRLATSRRYAQALLEHFDRARVTRRVGDEHVLRGRFH